MKIIEYIENLKTKPEHVRRRFAFLFSLGFTLIIFVGWMASYSIKSTPVLTDNKSVEKPLSSVTASVFDAFKDLKDMFVGTNKFEYTTTNIEVEPGNR